MRVDAVQGLKDETDDDDKISKIKMVISGLLNALSCHQITLVTQAFPPL